MPEGMSVAIFLAFLISLGILSYAIVFAFSQKFGSIDSVKKRYGRKNVIAYGKFNAASDSDYLAGEKCEVICLKDRIVVESKDYEISIANEKLLDVSVKAEKKKEVTYYPGIYGNISMQVKYKWYNYFYIKFSNEGEKETIIFDVEKFALIQNVQKAKKIEKKYKWLKKKQKKLEKNKKKTRVDI